MCDLILVQSLIAWTDHDLLPTLKDQFMHSQRAIGKASHSHEETSSLALEKLDVYSIPINALLIRFFKPSHSI